MKRMLTTLLLLIIPACGDAGSATTSPSVKQLSLELRSGNSIRLVQIAAGTFLMGSPASEPDRQADEAQREVEIAKPFYLGVTPVTVDQFAAFVNETGYKTQAEIARTSDGFRVQGGLVIALEYNGLNWKNPSFPQAGDHPVVQVSFNDALAFCDWLSKKSGRKVTLPTEAQWEYAARAGSATAYAWGDDGNAAKDFANVADQSLQKSLYASSFPFAPFTDGFDFTSPVARFKPNAWGVYDMHGNVCQWCLDDYSTSPEIKKVQRGGSWYNPLSRCRSAFRRGCPPDKRYDDDGFRIVVID